MAKLNGTGAPTRKTAGAMGDIYTDVSTGIQYECVFAYKDDMDAEFDCQWRELPNEGKKPARGQRQKMNPVEEVHHPEGTFPEPIEPEVKKEDAEKTMKEAASNIKAGKRTDYTSFGKNNNRK